MYRPPTHIHRYCMCVSSRDKQMMMSLWLQCRINGTTKWDKLNCMNLQNCQIRWWPLFVFEIRFLVLVSTTTTHQLLIWCQKWPSLYMSDSTVIEHNAISWTKVVGRETKFSQPIYKRKAHFEESPHTHHPFPLVGHYLADISFR